MCVSQFQFRIRPRTVFVLWLLAASPPAPLLAQSAPSGAVVTIAGSGTSGFSGDSGPATNAALGGPFGLSIGPDGAVYFADTGNFRIRKVDPVHGTISTVAGSGAPAGGFCQDGPNGDGGPGPAAEICDVFSVPVNRSRNTLYLASFSLGRVRQVNLATDIIGNYAGAGVFDPFPTAGEYGDGGAATAAWLEFPWGVAVGPAGDVFFTDQGLCRLRRVDALTGIISTIAGYDNPPGNPVSTSDGDGGPASAASLGNPSRVAMDTAGNLFLLDLGGFGQTPRVRRIDAATGIINTIAGGGTNAPGSGVATNMNLTNARDIAVAGDTLFISIGSQVFKLILNTGQSAPFAGTGVVGFGGDGGPALNAQFDQINGLVVVPGGGLLLSDTLNERIRYVAPDSIVLTNDSQQTAFYLPWVSALTGDFIVENDPTITNISAGSLTNVVGVVAATGNTACGTIDLSSLAGAGTVSVSSNTVCGTVILSNLASVGVISVGQNATVGSVDLGALTNATVVSVGDNASCGTIDLSSLATAGTVSVSSNTVCGTVILSNLASVEVIGVGQNATVGSVDLGALTNATMVSVGDNASCGTIDLSSLATACTVDISGNTSATNIDLSSLTNLCGDLTIASNAPDATVTVNGSISVGGGTNDATITVDGTIVVTNSDGLTVGTNATLTGNATVDGSVTNNGTISPGSSPGRFDINGALVLGGTSKLKMELGGYAPGQFDFIHVSGGASLEGTLLVRLLDNFLPVMTNGASFTLLTSGTPLAGAFANVADGGALTTTDAYARFTVRYAGLAAVQLSDLVTVDSDGDGLPDWWEDRYGQNKHDPSDAALDSDGDGVSNLNEFLAGTNPTNAASFFRLTAIEPQPGAVRLTWTTVGGKSYRVQASSGLLQPFADFSPLIAVPGVGESTTTLLDFGVPTNGPARCYRVRLGP